MHHICYHYPCQDGLGGAFAAFLALTLDCPAAASIKQKMEAKAVSFMALAIYEKESSRIDRARATFKPGDSVYICDFSGGLGFILTCCELVGPEGRVAILDHHKTAQEDLTSFFEGVTPQPVNLSVRFDMAKSGATVTRDYFGIDQAALEPVYGADMAAKMLRILDLMEDHDLWVHRLPDSTAFAAAVKELNLELDLTRSTESLNFLFRLCGPGGGLEALLERGRALEAYTKAAVAAECANKFPLLIEGTPTMMLMGGAVTSEDGSLQPPVLLHCYCVCTRRMELRSEIGNALAEESERDGLSPAAVVAYEEPGLGSAEASSTYKTSFRSLREFDVSAIARAYGGGGHRNASSAIVPRHIFDEWRRRGLEWRPPPEPEPEAAEGAAEGDSGAGSGDYYEEEQGEGQGEGEGEGEGEGYLAAPTETETAATAAAAAATATAADTPSFGGGGGGGGGAGGGGGGGV